MLIILESDDAYLKLFISSSIFFISLSNLSLMFPNSVSKTEKSLNFIGTRPLSRLPNPRLAIFRSFCPSDYLKSIVDKSFSNLMSLYFTSNNVNRNYVLFNFFNIFMIWTRMHKYSIENSKTSITSDLHLIKCKKV